MLYQFQVILSVSAENQNSTHAWRRPGLIRAANRTNLQINIPSQRDYTFKELKAIRDGKLSEEGVAKPGESQALAWLGHLDALQRYNSCRSLILSLSPSISSQAMS